MSFDKAIEYGKEKRKKYRGAKAIDRTCRNHGSCPWCENGRQYKNRKNALYVQAVEEEGFMEPDVEEDPWDDVWYEYDRIMDMVAEMEDF